MLEYVIQMYVLKVAVVNKEWYHSFMSACKFIHLIDID